VTLTIRDTDFDADTTHDQRTQRPTEEKKKTVGTRSCAQTHTRKERLSIQLRYDVSLSVMIELALQVLNGTQTNRMFWLSVAKPTAHRTSKSRPMKTILVTLLVILAVIQTSWAFSFQVEAGSEQCKFVVLIKVIPTRVPPYNMGRITHT
jgi:hypothetical protein